MQWILFLCLVHNSLHTVASVGYFNGITEECSPFSPRHPEYGGSSLLQKFRIHLPSCTAQHPIRLYFDRYFCEYVKYHCNCEFIQRKLTLQSTVVTVFYRLLWNSKCFCIFPMFMCLCGTINSGHFPKLC